MTRSWTDEERPAIPRNMETAWSILFLVLGLGILIVTPPMAMNPWIFGTSCLGLAVGVVFMFLSYRKDERS
jgi:hypothetical protein